MHGEMMTEKSKLVIIGGGVAGFRVAAVANQNLPEVQTIVITNRSRGVCSTCGIPYGIEERFEMQKLILARPEYYVEKGIEVRFETKVDSIDLNQNQVQISKLDNSDSETLDYDFLVIATGRVPFVPPIPGIDLEGVFKLGHYEDGVRLKDHIKTKKPKHGLVIGAGPIGMEMAWVLKYLGLESTVVELLPSVFPQSLDPDMAELVQKYYEESGIKIFTGTSVNGIFGQDSNVGYVTIGENNEKLDVDIIVLATGIRPNIELAKGMGLAIGELGGLVTDECLRVKNSKNGDVIPNVYACGDCIQVINGISSNPTISALASSVIPQARVIVESIATLEGPGSLTFKSYFSPNITMVGELQVGSVGLTTRAATKAGIKNITVGKSQGYTRSGYFPGKKQISYKLLFDQERLIGAQVVGGEAVKGHIDSLAVAMKAGFKLDQLILLERSYAPPLALLVDPIIGALEMARKEIESRR
jgi:NADH oxidase (H2O2-forming)